ncbi:hypothetical protein [Streptomyces sp. NPDC060194]|uniref:hypothetical protein n=1 Tax=Streptomyces sp. NPDC060194 TaxID=3347069 RepID=UPI00365371FA
MSDDASPAGPVRRLLLPLAAAVLLLPLLTAAHAVRAAPYGDRLTVHPAAAAEPAGGLRIEGRHVRAYAGGRPRWTYARPGHRPLAVAPAAHHAFALWSDGMVTDTVGTRVRWHRVVPGSARGALRPVDSAAVLAVVTPDRIVAFRTRDGDLRWTLPARTGCAFDPARTLGRAGRLIVAQPCPRRAWQSGLVAVDGLGRIAPDRRPLANEPGPPAVRPAKALAPPR